MTSERKKAWGVYAGGMSALLVGAWLTEVAGSMVPLALGASALLLCTASSVRVLWSGKPVRFHG